jgi:hypothetical protein
MELDLGSKVNVKMNCLNIANTHLTDGEAILTLAQQYFDWATDVEAKRVIPVTDFKIVSPSGTNNT